MKPKYAAFAALDPFFEVVQRGLSGLVDGKHNFETILVDVKQSQSQVDGR